MDGIASKKLIRKRGDDLPLGGARILGFIDENMLKAAVDFEQDPLGGRARTEQPIGGDNQIIIIEHAKAGFCRLVSGYEISRKAVNITRERQSLRGVQAVPQHRDSIALLN